MTRFVIMLLACSIVPSLGFAQMNVSGSLSKVLHHSERQEPTLFESGFKWQYDFCIGYKYKCTSVSSCEIAVGVEQRNAKSDLQMGNGFVVDNIQLTEVSVPISHKWMWGTQHLVIGGGPMTVLTKQTLTSTHWHDGQIEETIIIISPGISVVLRGLSKTQGEPGYFIQADGSVAHSLLKLGYELDLSEYGHHYSQLGLRFGVQF